VFFVQFFVLLSSLPQGSKRDEKKSKKKRSARLIDCVVWYQLLIKEKDTELDENIGKKKVGG
jgi:hypothetical protein